MGKVSQTRFAGSVVRVEAGITPPQSFYLSQEWRKSENPSSLMLLLKRRARNEGRPFRISEERKLRLWVRACRQQLPEFSGKSDLSVAKNLYQAVNDWSVDGPAPSGIVVGLMRDIFMNPFPVVEVTGWYRTEILEGHNGYRVNVPTAAPQWRTPAVLSLIKAAVAGVDERGELPPEPLAILADALEDAGCTSRDVLDHLRGCENRCGACYGTGYVDNGDSQLHPCGVCPPAQGPHVRGCWVLDLFEEGRFA